MTGQHSKFMRWLSRVLVQHGVTAGIAPPLGAGSGGRSDTDTISDQ